MIRPSSRRWSRVLPLVAFCLFATAWASEARTPDARPEPGPRAARVLDLDVLREWLPALFPAPAPRVREARRPETLRKCGGGIDPNGKPCG